MNNDGKGSGPWGNNGGSGGPWGSSGGSDSNTPPPDIEDFIRKGQNRFKDAVPPIFGAKGGMFVVLLVIFGLWAATGFYRVLPNEQGAVLRFGSFSYMTGAGLHYHLPVPIETVMIPDVTRENREEIGFRTIQASRYSEPSVQSMPKESLMLTGDENIVDIDFTVTWVVKDARDYLFNMRDPAGTVRVAAEGSMREVIGKTRIVEVLTMDKEEIQLKTSVLLQEVLDSYGAGIRIKRVKLLEVNPPKLVIDAFNDVQRAKTDKERLRNEAEAYKREVIPRARGEAAKKMQGAEAYKAEVVNRATGDANRFSSVLNGYKKAKNVTAKRMYLETMEKVMGKSELVIIDQSKGGQGVIPYLPLPEIGSRRGGK